MYQQILDAERSDCLYNYECFFFVNDDTYQCRNNTLIFIFHIFSGRKSKIFPVMLLVNNNNRKK